jgi:Flp pilus assembly protein TadD
MFAAGYDRFQLGTLAMLEGNLAEAETRYQSTLTTFRTLDEPEQEAIVWHQLGMIYRRAKAWEQAEQAYRASAQLEEAQGNLVGATRTWNNLAIVCEYSGKPERSRGLVPEGDRCYQESFGYCANIAITNQPRWPSAKSRGRSPLRSPPTC